MATPPPGPPPAPPPRAITLSTADGLSLEAELAPVADEQAMAVAVICHPHPLYGGSMHNNVVHRLFTDLPALGIPSVRFNFRGAGRSEGTHGAGRDEVADVVAALDAAAEHRPGVPVLLAGYSFGADVSLSVDDDRVGGWLAVSPPLRIVDPAEMVASRDPRPKVLVAGTADDFRPAGAAEDVTAGWPATEVRGVDGVDHFWMRGLEHLASAAETLLGRLTISRRPGGP